MCFVLLDTVQDSVLVSIKEFTRKYILINDAVNFVEIHDEIQFTSAGEISIQEAHEEVDTFKMRQLVIFRADTDAKEEAGILTIHNFVRLVKKLKLYPKFSLHSKAKNAYFDRLFWYLFIGKSDWRLFGLPLRSWFCLHLFP